MPCIRHSANKKHRHQHYWFDILPYTIEYPYHTVKRSDVYSAFTEWPFFNLFDYVYIDEPCLLVYADGYCHGDRLGINYYWK